MLTYIRRSKWGKTLALYLCFTLIFQVIMPMPLRALTGGPSQPEVQSFEPIGTTEMVDPFSGDFTYNIPLLDVGGYPINISYNSGIGMDDEASWVGLGWNINPGVINRSMRALPDDFDGDEVKKEFNIKENRTYGVRTGAEIGELFGVSLDFISIQAGLGVSYNTYNGMGLDISIEPSINAARSSKGDLNVGLGLSASSESGVDVSPNVSFQKTAHDKDKKTYKVSKTASIGTNVNSREGLTILSMSFTLPKDKVKKFKILKKLVPGSLGTDISFSTPSYTPQIQMPLNNASLSVSATLGAEIFGLHSNLRLTGYFSGQFLKTHQQTLPAYGYLNTQNGADKDKVLLDFNREGDGSFSKNKPNIPSAVNTYDVYSIAGQGIGGMYRPFRNDYGVLFDSKMTNHSGGLDVPGLEIGGGNGFHLGSNFTVNYVKSESGKWTDDNSAKDKLQFTGRSLNDPFYEPVYFKQAGEKTVDSDGSMLAAIGGADPVRIKLNHATEDVPATSFYERFPGGADVSPQVLPIATNKKRQKRQPRNECITTQSAQQAAVFGLIREIEDYGDKHVIDSVVINGVSSCTPGKGRYIPRATKSRTNWPKHHLSEITAIRPDGMRYVYAIPCYNRTQEEVSFAVDDQIPDCHTGLIGYSAQQASTGNESGSDHFFSKTVMPPFAHSYLLSAIVSSDYVDLTGNGPSDDDMGTYTRFNYTLAIDDYHWRVPYERFKANYNEGLKSLGVQDDKASYIYGEKQLYYLHSIETKTHVAEFELGDRADGYGVIDRDGGRGGAPMKLLKQIRLYAKPDKLRSPWNAQPLKVVHFEYDYSLCPDIPNNDNTDYFSGLPGVQDKNGFPNSGGKLTLKKVFFTYQNSMKGHLTPYTFEYAQVRVKDGSPAPGGGIMNPSYNLKGYDRWGNYKENPPGANCNMSVIDDIGLSPLSNAEYPYTDQYFLSTSDNFDQTPGLPPDRTQADLYAYAWNLTTIDLPSGGKIKVDYEADDYAYVQDQRAMQMFKVVGCTSNTPTISDLSTMHDHLYDGILQENDYVIVRLDNPYPATATQQQFYDDFLSDKRGNQIEHLYFRFLINLHPLDKKFDYVPGYAAIDGKNYDFIHDGSNPIQYAYVKLKEVKIQDKVPGIYVNSIAQASWNYAKLYNPRLAYNQSDPTSNAMMQIFESMVAIYESIEDLAVGYNRTARLKGYSQTFVPYKSWIRLYHPDNSKKGGGCRVKRVIITDEWQDLTDNTSYNNAQYGQEYDYTTTNEYGKTISSGVAAYEPILGNDENPLKQPLFYSEDHLLVPDDNFYSEEPVCESLFPGPSVGYSKVTVRNLQYNNVKRHATGKVVHEFYTANDFPVRVLQTPTDPVRKKPNPLLKLLKVKVRDFMTVSQGYSIELNDMHGKNKAQMVYAEDKDNPISGVQYFYEQSGAKQLNNEVMTMNNAGVIKKQTIGVDYDFAVDMREQDSDSKSGGIQANTDFFLLGILPITLPVFMPQSAWEHTRFRSAATTKVINRYGLLKKTVAYDLGAQVSTSNKLYDADTGEVILTETKNQYEDPVFNFIYPAHWAYDGMGQAYRNVDLIVSAAAALSHPAQYFTKGDEVTTSISSDKGWVTQASGGLNVSKSDGSPLLLGGLIKILRSGRKNMQNIPIGTVASLANPLLDTNGDGQADLLFFNRVLDAGAVEFADQWGLFCNCGVEPGQRYNPYFAGALGNYRMKRSFLHLSDRVQQRLNNNTNIRTDGIFSSFTPFWKPPGSDGLWQADSTNWTFTSEVTIYNPHGMELENRDALNRYSAAVYGYNNALPVAVASNARYREVGFDSFEDYDFCDCPDDHFSFEILNPTTTEKESHSGRRSISLQPGASLEIRKVVVPCDSLDTMPDILRTTNPKGN